MRYMRGLACAAFAGAAMMLSAPVAAQEEEAPAAPAEAAPAAEPSGGVDVITVTAQKTEESLLDVPIAVTAFDSEGLDRLQIDNVSDLQFNIPNVTFTKGNFTGTNFQIRGIGATLVAASADTGVGIHMNDVYLNSNRIFELEYFDIERVEVLRGPQGTLYGRNATGGSVNMITKRPVMNEYEVILEGQMGNYHHRKIKGAVNIPISDDRIAFRAAGIFVDREGYTENIFDGRDIDGRTNYAVRGSLRLQPTETTTFDFMVSHFKEDSDRLRAQKQMCHRDDSAVLGCLPDKLAFENVNGNATLGGLLTSDAVLPPFLALQPLNGPGGFAFVENPADMRKVNTDFKPIYRADETFFMGQLDQELFGGDITLTLLAAHQITGVFSQQDYNLITSEEIEVPPLLALAFPTVFNTYYSDGLFPISDIDPGNTGLIGGNIRNRSNLSEAYDQSSSDSTQTSFEGRIRSNFDGPFNFLLAGYWLTYDSVFDYFVVATTLDYFSLLGAGIDGIALASPFYSNNTASYTLDSWAAFGEAYYNITPELKLTGGLRYTVDQKFLRDRQILVNSPVLIGTTDANPFLPPFREDDVEFSEITGRAVLDWSPDLSFTDASLFYASYSRGYKAGGLNPPIDPALFENTPAAFEPEFINAYEIGMKHTLLDNTLQANISAFYYDYGGLQVSKIQNRTSINENIDATIWGVEGEFLYAPDDRWQFNVSASYLNSEIGESESIDTRDPTNGSDMVTLLKEYQASNCVIEHNGNPDPWTAGLDVTVDAVTAGALDLFEAPIPTEGIAFSGFTGSCAALNDLLEGPLAFLGYTVSDGVPVSLEGNELQYAPEWTVSAGAQYTHPFSNGMRLTGRFDYYWQADMWARIFNKPIDLIDSWDVMNASLTLYGSNDDWYLRFFVQNIANSDNITGQYVTDPSSGLYTNLFILDPRLYGVTLGLRF